MMPSYFFSTSDKLHDLDSVSADLPSLEAARCEAIKFAGQCMQERPEALTPGKNCWVEVRDEHGTLLATVVILAIDAPAARGERWAFT